MDNNNASLILGVLGLVSIPLLLAAWLVWVSAAHAVSISSSDPDVCAEAADEMLFDELYYSDDDDDLPTLDGEPRRVDDAPTMYYWRFHSWQFPNHTGSGSPAEIAAGVWERGLDHD